MSRSHLGLVEAVKQAGLGENVNFLLVVDQFEEIFRYSEAGQQQQEVANEFVSLLLEAVAQSSVPIYIVLTMRSDFIGDCGGFEGLAETVNRGEFLIPRLSREQYKRVIEAPIKVAGGQITPRLLQRLLNDLGQQADQLPCLQHALMRTWSIWSQRGSGGALDLDDYQRVGRMSEALSLHADEIYQALESEHHRELCAGHVPGAHGPGVGEQGNSPASAAGGPVPDSRSFRGRAHSDHRRVPATTRHVSHPLIRGEVERKVDHRHFARKPDARLDALRRWVDEEAQAVGIYRRLSESAQLHAQGKAGLYRDPELGIALAWQEMSRPNEAWAERYHAGFLGAMAFLEASRNAAIAPSKPRNPHDSVSLSRQKLAEIQQQRLEQQQRAARDSV